MRYSKYHNKKYTDSDGQTFDSKKEYRIYCELLLRQRAGEITDLKRQQPFEIIPPLYQTETVQLKTKEKEVKRLVQKGITYIADFTYTENGKQVVVDCKASAEFQDKVSPKGYYLHNCIHQVITGEVRELERPRIYNKKIRERH